MGNFYVNHTVRTEDRVKLRSVLRHNKLTAYISPAKNGCVVVAEQQAATQATAPIVSLAKLLSIEAQAPVLVAADHDDDFLHLALYESGQEITDYSSDPSHVVEDKETDLAGKAAKLCTAFDVPEAVEAVAAILQAQYAFAVERHGALIAALRLSDFAVGFGYRYLSRGELPPALELIRTP